MSPIKLPLHSILTLVAISVFALRAISLASAHSSADPAADQRIAPAVTLKNPYFGEPRERTIPIDSKPTIVVHCDPARSLVPMDLIRILRWSSTRQPAAAPIEIAVVFVRKPEAGASPVDWANHQRSLLKLGMQDATEYISLWDETGDWYEQLGRPALPHAILIGPDRRIQAEQIFVGPWDWECQRISAILAGESPAPHQPVEATLPPDLVIPPPLPMPESAGGSYQVDEQGYARRTNFEAILPLLEQRFGDQAKQAVQEFCTTTTGLTHARRFAEASLKHWGAEKVPWAKAVVETRADGRASPSAYDLHLMTSVENASATEQMSFTLRSRLVARWDNQFCAERRHSYIVQPGAVFTSFIDDLQSAGRGWGDYRVEFEGKVVMSSGDFPNHHQYPPYTFRREEHVTFFPEPSAYISDDEVPTGRSDARRFLAAVLRDHQEVIYTQWREAQAARENPGAAGLLRKVQQSAAALAGSVIESATGPDSHRGRAFTTLPIAVWIQRAALPAQTPAPDSPSFSDTLVPRAGRVTLIDFMFTTCPPCLASLPKISALSVDLRDRGLDVVSLAPSWGGNGLRNLIDRHSYKHDFAILQSEAENLYGVRGYPSYLLVDRKGVIRSVSVGAMPPREEIDALLKE